MATKSPRTLNRVRVDKALGQRGPATKHQKAEGFYRPWHRTLLSIQPRLQVRNDLKFGPGSSSAHRLGAAWQADETGQEIPGASKAGN